MNYVFISPAYPVTCTQFCDRLHKHGVNVLGIGDVPYDTLNDQLKSSLMEYYFVDSLEDYDQVYRAVAFFIHKYGRIDWLESLNEYWLPVDARLRTDFNIAVGTREDKIGDLVREGDRVGNVDGVPVYALTDGKVRGLLQDGVPVTKGLKSGDVDPRGATVDHMTVSDKALSIGGGVLEAILSYAGERL